MCNKISEFSFYPDGSNEGRKTTFPFFLQSLSLELHLHFQEWIIDTCENDWVFLADVKLGFGILILPSGVT